MSRASKAVFTCQHEGCGQGYTIEELRIAAIRHGIIYLDRKAVFAKGIIGITCTSCKKTTLNKYSKRKYEEIKNKLGKSLNIVRYRNVENPGTEVPFHTEIVPENVYLKKNLAYRSYFAGLNYTTFNVDYDNIANKNKAIKNYYVTSFLESAKTAPLATILNP